jgi:hypothetical protein
MNELERQYIEWRTTCPWVYERFKQLAEEYPTESQVQAASTGQTVRWDIPLEIPSQRNRPCG